MNSNDVCVGFVLGVLAVLIAPFVAFLLFRQQIWHAFLGAFKLHLEKYNKLKRPKRIILIRHGESQANIDERLYQTVPDNKIELTDKGKQQAFEAGKQLRSIIGDETVTFYVSCYTRSRQTASELIRQFNKHKYHIIEDPRLREQEWGNFQHPDVIMQALEERPRVGAFYYRFPNGESGSDVYDRVSAFLETLFRHFEAKDCRRNVVIVTHGLFVRLFLMRYFKWSVERFHTLQNLKNCEYAIMELQKDGSYELVTPLRTTE